MRLTTNVVQNFACAKVITDNDGGTSINALDFSNTGEFLVTSGDDESLHLYDVNTGVRRTELLSKKYGISMVRFTHHAKAVVCASKNTFDHTLRYWALHDNRYLRYFQGHRDEVVGLSMSPENDTFVSASRDKTIRLWDLRSDACQGLMRTPGVPSVTFENMGVVLAATLDAKTLGLFDLRALDKGPFLTQEPSTSPICENVSSISFSPDGKHILISSNGNDPAVHLVDAFKATLIRSWKARHQAGQQPVTWGEASFSPDAMYVAGAASTGAVHIWSRDQDQAAGAADPMQPLVTLGPGGGGRSGHPSAVTSVRWNPKAAMMASACSALLWWVPKRGANMPH